MTLRETILQETLELVKKEGLDELTEADIMDRLDISNATFREIFSGMDDLVNKVIIYDGEQQEVTHQKILKNSPDAVEDIMLIVQGGIKQAKEINQSFYKQLQEKYPKAWQLAQDHLYSYTYPLVQSILNKGVLEGNFRKDINIQLVTKILMTQLLMMLNPALFPPDRYDLAEVFRSIFMYYLRGICTDNGAKLAEGFFSRNNL